MKLDKLKAGDTIAMIAPAKFIAKEVVDHAVSVLEKQGFKVELSENCLGTNKYFSGTIQERANDLQWAINHERAKAIFCVRGGYGCVQIVDLVDWSKIKSHSKWLVGFSDISVFHQKLDQLGIPSIHATMPLNYKENSTASLDSLFQCLTDRPTAYTWTTAFKNFSGTANGKLIGGNLAVFTGLIGTDLMPNYKDKILFIEDVGEAHYAIDRAFYQMKKAGVFKQIKGLILGDFSSLTDSNPPYGKSFKEIIALHFENNNIPVAFDFPAGHCDDNRALVLGHNYTLRVKENKASLQ